eukprot:CAMPEP_0201686622 /NCGR_PEP_ID=MMETSP0578-20130828/998_1 /ASSEMBLY_ACC=CAM_ASM_000663 /TAXON_ID=267565 /ORGANISM="Skeletonema grethea, Strain CCMP 1804" /LENGTH=303 /DNA_ID=CAMNT_0048170693 /DNA_START=41 /DNA_END=949 /DNA_ORIENTATION=-
MSKISVALLLAAIAATATNGFSVPSPSSTAEINNNAKLKSDLLQRIQKLRILKERDGDFSIDFGVKGGEIDKKTRAPQKVDFYTISEDVGKAADEVMDITSELEKCSPTDYPTQFLGDKEQGKKAPLNGEWKLLFTTAADANFSKNSKRGSASVKNVVDACRGSITNVIDFQGGSSAEETDDDDATPSAKKEPLVKSLNVVIGAKAASKSRVGLQFKYAKVVFSRFFGLKQQWNLYIPVPAPLITRLIVFFSRVFRFGKKVDKKVPPKAYFDVLYLDDELRIQRTGEDNLFVQAKPTWKDAVP